MMLACDAKIATDEDEPSIVTYLELQEWVANGNGQVLVRCKDEISHTPVYTNTVTYPEGKDNEIVPWVRTARMGECYIMIRRYGDKEPANPTREYMRVPAPGYSSVAVLDSATHKNSRTCSHDVPDWNTVTKEGRNG